MAMGFSDSIDSTLFVGSRYPANSLVLILVLPNFPFFYAVYRIWSHHKGDFL